MISLFANTVDAGKLGAGAGPIEVCAAGAGGSQEWCAVESGAAGFAGMLLALLGDPRPAADVPVGFEPPTLRTPVADDSAAARAARPAIDIAAGASSLALLAPPGLPTRSAPAESDGMPIGRATYLAAGIADLLALTTAGGQRASRDDVGTPQAAQMAPRMAAAGVAQVAFQAAPKPTVAATDLASSAPAPGRAPAGPSDAPADPRALAEDTAQIAFRTPPARAATAADGIDFEIKWAARTPQTDVQAPARGTGSQVDDETPARDAAPQVEAAASKDGVMAAEVEAAIPRSDATAQVNVAVPRRAPMTPRVSATAPQTEVPASEGGAMYPQRGAPAPAGDALPPDDGTSSDGGRQVPVQRVDVAASKGGVMAAEVDTGIPRNGATTPQVDAAMSRSGVALPQADTPAAQGDAPQADHRAPLDPGRHIAGGDEVAGRRGRVEWKPAPTAGPKPAPTAGPTPAGQPGATLRTDETSVARVFLPGAVAPRVVPAAVAAVAADGKVATVQATGEESAVGVIGGNENAIPGQPGVTLESGTGDGQMADGGEKDRPVPPTVTSASRRDPEPVRFDSLDSQVSVGVPAGPKVEGRAAVDPAPQAEHVFSAVLDRVESAKAAGREHARFEIQTDDGQAIDVKISIHRNVVRARIGVATAEMQGALAGRIWELGQRLESGGLTPESLEVVLVGDWGGGSRQGGQRRQSRPRTEYAEQDQAAATLVEAEANGFERWI